VPDIRIRVGASLDASMESVFGSVEKNAQRTRKNVQKEMDALGASIGRGVGKGADKSEREFAKIRASVTKYRAEIERDIAKSAAKQAAIEERAAQQSIKSAEKEEAARERLLARRLAALAKTVDREQRLEARRAEQAKTVAARAAARGGMLSPSVWNPRIRTSIPNPWNVAISGARRLAGDLARGAGVETDAGAYVQSYVQRQSLATDIANSGYQRGQKGAAGHLQNAGDIQKEAMQVAMATATDSTKALEGLQKFVAITGDLETGRAILGDMAKLSNATGSSLEEVVDAAGEISAKLGDIPDKANVINAVMRQIGGAGKMGAVEMRDFASQLGKIAGLASRFAGDKGTNIGEMGILMQLARQKGGSGSAAQAATAVTGFVAAMRTPANLKNYEALTGRSAYVDKGRTTLASPEALIMQALASSHGSQPALAKIFSKRAMDVVGGAANIFNEAGGGTKGGEAKGLAAVGEYFQGLRKATLSAAEVEDANARKMASSAALATTFNNTLQTMADDATPKLLGALKDLAPAFIAAAGAITAAIVGITTGGSEASEALGGPSQGLMKTMGQSLWGIAAGSFGGDKVNYNLSGASGTIAALNDLSGTGSPLDDTGRFQLEGKKSVSKQELAGFRGKRDEAQNQVATDEEMLDHALARFNASDAAKAKGGDWSEIEKGAHQEGAWRGSEGGKAQQAALDARDRLAADKETSAAIAQALERVMQGIFSGGIEVTVKNFPNSTGGGPVADRSGVMPASRGNGS
jgi:hypothetical protein